MRLWRLVKLFAGGGLLVVLGAAALMLWPLLWPPDPDASVQLVNGRLMGEATGYVGHIDRDARTVDVSASLVGWRPVVLTVNETTAIIVQNRQGGFGDLWKDMPVRVSYEVVGDRRLAKSIEVVTGDGEPPPQSTANSAVNTPASPAAAPPGPSIAPPAAVLPPPAADIAPPPTVRVADPPPVRTQAPPSPPPARAAESPPVKSPPSVPPPPSRAAVPVAPEKPAPAADPPRPVEPPAARAPQPRAEAPSPARRSGDSESDSGDGAAAIDWLLKERGGR